ncbi:Gfo/Idh/MocA family protein [Microbacterium sp. 179-I 3D2 NHS]|uniref:Gfo/Idh/MocA family protein n=1 Tax=Microbacterium sp. 179-I 3D2 NHS TaxID=3235178 RepID=UPI0039A36194
MKSGSHGTATRTRPLRVAAVGLGARSGIAAHVASAPDAAEVVALVDVTDEGRDRGRMLHPTASVHSSVAELIAAQTGDRRIDAAIVTTPDDTHEEVAVALLRAGIAVYLEKPLAISVEGADRILTAAAETGTGLYVGHNYRHSSVVQTMRGVIERGEIGEVRAVWVRHFVGNGGDYYFKDWHADRTRTNSLLLQKGSHDIDVIHYLASGYTRRVVGMGELMLYGGIADRHSGSSRSMPEWFSMDNWPPAAHTGLNPVVDVEDVSMMLMTLDNGVLASYQQCHFTPDYWRNYTVIGTEGRLENVGDTAGGVVKVWNRRHEWQVAGDVEYPIGGDASGHVDADVLTIAEFLAHVARGVPTVVSPIAAREAVAAGAMAAASLRDGSLPRDVPPLDPDVAGYFSRIGR